MDNNLLVKYHWALSYFQVSITCYSLEQFQYRPLCYRMKNLVGYLLQYTIGVTYCIYNYSISQCLQGKNSIQKLNLVRKLIQKLCSKQSEFKIENPLKITVWDTDFVLVYCGLLRIRQTTLIIFAEVIKTSLSTHLKPLLFHTMFSLTTGMYQLPHDQAYSLNVKID